MAGLVEDGDGSHCAGEDLSLASMCREEAPAEAQAGAADAVFLEDAVVVDGFDADYFSHCDGTAADLAVARSVFNTAVRALVQRYGPDDLNSALMALGPYVNLRRIEGSGRLALHAALAKHIIKIKTPTCAI